MNQYERTNNDDLPFLPIQLLAETCIFRRPHVLMLPEHEARSLGCWSDDPAAYGAFQQHKDNGLDGCLEFGRDLQTHQSRQRVWGWSSDAALFGKRDLNFLIFRPPSTLLFTQKKLTIMFTILTRVLDGDIRCVRLRGLTDVRGIHIIKYSDILQWSLSCAETRRRNTSNINIFQQYDPILHFPSASLISTGPQKIPSFPSWPTSETKTSFSTNFMKFQFSNPFNLPPAPPAFGSGQILPEKSAPLVSQFLIFYVRWILIPSERFP